MVVTRMVLMEYCTKIKHMCTITTMHRPVIRIVLARTAIQPQKHNDIVERQHGIKTNARNVPCITRTALVHVHYTHPAVCVLLGRSGGVVKFTSTVTISSTIR